MSVVPPENERSGAPAPGDEREHGPALTVAAVARLLGVAPATLRTWDRRYGLGPSSHSAGAHRRYVQDDVDRLLAMRRLTLEGVAPGDAARSVRDADVGHLRALAEGRDAADGPTGRAGTLDGETSEAAAPAAGAPRSRGPAAAGSGPVAPLAAPGTGGPTHVVPDLEEPPEGSRRGDRTGTAAGPRPLAVAHAARTRPATALDVVEAALRHDEVTCRALLQGSGVRDVVRWWEQLVAPAFVDLGARTVLARPGEAPELVLTAAVLTAIRSRPAPATELAGERPIVLLLTAPGEPRPCSLHVLAAALTDRGVDARIVTGPMRPRHVLELCVMTKPVAVVLVAEQRAPDLAVVRELVDAEAERPVFVHVRDALAAEQLPVGRSVHRVRSFSGLVHEVLAVAAE